MKIEEARNPHQSNLLENPHTRFDRQRFGFVAVEIHQALGLCGQNCY